MEGAARCATLTDTRWTFHNSGYASELELFTHSGTKQLMPFPRDG